MLPLPLIKRMTKVVTVVVLAVAALASALPVLACSPPAAPAQAADESDPHYRARLEASAAEEQAQILAEQQRAWDRSAAVLIVRVETVGFDIDKPSPRPARTRTTPAPAAKGTLPVRPARIPTLTNAQALLTPLYAAKGALPATPFIVENAIGSTTCGLVGAGVATSACPGDLVAVYLLSGGPGMRTLLAAIARGSILDPRVCGLLDAEPSGG